jgi:hypothetical protein
LTRKGTKDTKEDTKKRGCASRKARRQGHAGAFVSFVVNVFLGPFLKGGR